jgi:hypothetical protein
MDECISPDELSLGHVLLMFVLDTVLYTMLAQYLDAVLPSDFGVRQPWYFIFRVSSFFMLPSTAKRILHSTHFYLNNPLFIYDRVSSHLHRPIGRIVENISTLRRNTAQLPAKKGPDSKEIPKAFLLALK